MKPGDIFLLVGVVAAGGLLWVALSDSPKAAATRDRVGLGTAPPSSGDVAIGVGGAKGINIRVPGAVAEKGMDLLSVLGIT